MACLTVISLLILLRASWLWRFNEHAGAFSVEPDTLEYVFMIAAAAAVAGGLAWIFQALNGARLAGRANSRKTVSRGNWAAVALLISIVAFATLSQPALVAESLGEAAEAASAEGMRIIPLYMAKAAVRLDPSRPEYTIGVIGLLEGSGETAAADAARRELVARLEPTISLLEVEGLVSPVSRDGAEAVVPAAPLFEKHGPVTSTRVPAELMILEGRM
jgi:hypothetical protein